MSAFSVFIPSVYANITAPMISETFHRMNVGHVKHIEFVPQNSNNGRVRQNKAYVFFDALYQSDLAMEIYNNVSNNMTTKLPYGRSEHVFWILLNSKRHVCVWMGVCALCRWACACVCVCVCEREKDSERDGVCVCCV